MKLIWLTYVILQINAAIDSGKHEDISIEEAEDHVEAGDLFRWLRQRCEMDLGYLDDEKARAINEALERIRAAYAGDERRRWGVQNSGLCILLAWVNELIQQRTFTD